MTRRRNKKRNAFHSKIKKKEATIRRSGNEVDFSENKIEEVMTKYGFTDYKIKFWGNIYLTSKFDNWIISTDKYEEVIFLHHATFQIDRKGNNRSSYHVHNVYYDLDFCVKSISEHDEYKENKAKKEKVNNKERYKLEDP